MSSIGQSISSAYQGVKGSFEKMRADPLLPFRFVQLVVKDLASKIFSLVLYPYNAFVHEKYKNHSFKVITSEEEYAKSQKIFDSFVNTKHFTDDEIGRMRKELQECAYSPETKLEEQKKQQVAAAEAKLAQEKLAAQTKAAQDKLAVEAAKTFLSKVYDYLLGTAPEIDPKEIEQQVTNYAETITTMQSQVKDYIETNKLAVPDEKTKEVPAWYQAVKPLLSAQVSTEGIVHTLEYFKTLHDLLEAGIFTHVQTAAKWVNDNKHVEGAHHVDAICNIVHGTIKMSVQVTTAYQSFVGK